jgi:hypothetical protein
MMTLNLFSVKVPVLSLQRTSFLVSTTTTTHKYYPKLGTQNNRQNTTAAVHEIKMQEQMSEY